MSFWAIYACMYTEYIFTDIFFLRDPDEDFAYNLYLILYLIESTVWYNLPLLMARVMSLLSSLNQIRMSAKFHLK